MTKTVLSITTSFCALLALPAQAKSALIDFGSASGLVTSSGGLTYNAPDFNGTTDTTGNVGLYHTGGGATAWSINVTRTSAATADAGFSADTDENNQVRWRGSLLNAGDWKAGSMKLFNSSAEPLGIAAGKKRIQLSQGKSVDFNASEWRESFPVKIFRLQPELKTIFSSTWRVSAGRRELLFIAGANGSVTLRSLFDLSEISPESAP